MLYTTKSTKINFPASLTFFFDKIILWQLYKLIMCKICGRKGKFSLFRNWSRTTLSFPMYIENDGHVYVKYNNKGLIRC